MVCRSNERLQWETYDPLHKRKRTVTPTWRQKNSCSHRFYSENAVSQIRYIRAVCGTLLPVYSHWIGPWHSFTSWSIRVTWDPQREATSYASLIWSYYRITINSYVWKDQIKYTEYFELIDGQLGPVLLLHSHGLLCLGSDNVASGEDAHAIR
jgi:hypothetical protein